MRSPRVPALGRLALALCLGLAVALPGTNRASAQATGTEPAVQVPGFWDPRRRPERPDLSRLTVIRFLTETDYPPFNFAGPDGNPQGFNIDLARMMCEELKLACTIQMRRFETLLPTLGANRKQRDPQPENKHRQHWHMDGSPPVS